MSDDHPLLVLQRIDASGDALRREREALPERAALAACRASEDRVDAERASAEERRTRLGAEERRLEGEVAALRAQAREVETTLYSGTVKAIAELEGLQAKLASLRAQQAALEEEEIGILEAQEALDEELLALDRQRAGLAQQGAELTKALEAGEARIDARLAETDARREAHLPEVPPAPRAAYERLRASARFGGLVAAALEKDYCGACRTSLPVTVVTRLRAADPDDVVRCQKCQRLLVAG